MSEISSGMVTVDAPISHSAVVAPNSPLAYLFLAIIATAGIYYANVMPALVGALIDAAGFSEQQAGYVASANIYGSALGALIATLWVKKMAWKRVMFAVLVPFIALDFLSAFVLTPTALMLIRFTSGVLGGLIVTSSFAMMARLNQPDRAFGLMFALSLGFAGVGVYILPGLVVDWGIIGLFSFIASFSLLALMVLPFLPSFQLEQTHTAVKKAQDNKHRLTLLLVLAGIFLFQCANMGIFAYLQRLGLDAGLDVDWISLCLAVGLWICIPSSSLVVLVGGRFGHAKPVVLAGSLMLVTIYLLHHAANAQVFLWASLMLSVSLSLMVPYLFGVCAALDSTGQGTASGALASKLGMATGPLVSAWLLGYGGYPVILNTFTFAVLFSVFIALVAIRRVARYRVKSL